MSQQVIALPYGKGTMDFAVPESQLVGIYSPKDIPPVSDIKIEIRRALAHPIASPPLQELVRGKTNVVFVADDNTRLTPTDQELKLGVFTALIGAPLFALIAWRAAREWRL